jgi:hypothetical protein
MAKVQLIAWLDNQINEHLKMAEVLNKEGEVKSADCENSMARAFIETKDRLVYGPKKAEEKPKEEVSLSFKFTDSKYDFISCDQDGKITISDKFVEAIEQAFADRLCNPIITKINAKEAYGKEENQDIDKKLNAVLNEFLDKYYRGIKKDSQ